MSLSNISREKRCHRGITAKVEEIHVSLRAQEKTSSLRKKSSPHFLLLKTHATPTPAHFEQNTPQKCQEKKSLGKENGK